MDSVTLGRSPRPLSEASHFPNQCSSLLDQVFLTEAFSYHEGVRIVLVAARVFVNLPGELARGEH